AVAREVMEESGIKVKNLRYVTSQPWPFPQSLMTAFMAEYDSGAMLCSHCRERYYPQIAPCIIVAIRRDDSILLAQHTRHRNGVHTVLAGFVEVGETLEQAVAREVMEESGIKVKNLRYVTSQPWPFPQSLMTAFMAEYDSG
ncbi:NAD(+) diphosphatase, partial [Escherichia coli]